MMTYLTAHVSDIVGVCGIVLWIFIGVPFIFAALERDAGVSWWRTFRDRKSLLWILREVWAGITDDTPRYRNNRR